MSTLINIFITSFLSLVFGVIFFQIGTKDRAMPGVTQGQLGALINVNISTMMGQAQSALIVFASERRLFLREYSTGHYGILPYFLSHLASEAFVSFLVMVIQALIVYFMIGFQQSFFHLLGITFALAMTSTAVAVALGSFFSDMKAAESLFTLVVVPQMYFSGVFLAIELIPEWIRWSQYLCSLTYASRLSFAYEFSNCDAGVASENCDLILNQNGVSEDDVWWYWLALIALFVFFRTVAVIVLRQRGKSFS
jgi:ABC-type multidrug transport system permease subunit